ncbi:3-hydroxylacyl-ACP dehydratase [Parahaliea aestuarii]|uniref:3-hydroxylacyl-ACP dehydratase n=1 Tax=Parahaliea aestuarii TaxID=1852021 RepID=A0A5C8ZPN0_9GAMM|nr:3-hydroxylacyl-ACP dehydratase [Parahaliea aestuarii]TXS90453.1 3-hydroxylacyl-ACP dehydratase [Parahaliea aestuarii]
MAAKPTFPPVAELLPHRPPMRLLDAVVSAAEGEICCALQVAADGRFDSAGSVPAWLGLEYMAQAVAALAGWEAHQRGEPPRVGFLLGTRHFETNTPRLPCGAQLQVSARRLLQTDSGMGSFDCQLLGPDVSQRARLAAYEPKDLENYLEQPGHE